MTTPYFNTAIAARHVAEMGDKRYAAIASRLAAKHYGDVYKRQVVGFFGEDCERVSFKTFDEVFAAVADGKARYGVVPVENSSDVYKRQVRDDQRMADERGIHHGGGQPERHPLRARHPHV